MVLAMTNSSYHSLRLRFGGDAGIYASIGWVLADREGVDNERVRVITRILLHLQDLGDMTPERARTEEIVI